MFDLDGRLLASPRGPVAGCAMTGVMDDPAAALERYLAHLPLDADDAASVAACARQLVEAGLDRLPLPGHGRTLERWRLLSVVAARDLGLVKLFEGHTDALAILAELGHEALAASGLWAVWAAEAPHAPLQLEMAAAPAPGHARLHGTKAWCSGAAGVDHALVTCTDDTGQHRLAAVALAQPGVAVTKTGWHAVGMAATASVEVRFDGAAAVAIGPPGAYLQRPGFWHGGAGIAACWYGAAAALGEMVRARVQPRREPYRDAHLGAVDTALAGAAALLRETAGLIDRHPRDDAHRLVLRARLGVEHAADRVLSHAGRALGAGPLCQDRRFARCMADLPVFLRQSHAERDLAELGVSVVQEEARAWKL